MNVQQLIQKIAERFDKAQLSYGHGTDNPLDEAAWLVFATLHCSHDDAPAIYSTAVDDDQVAAALDITERRIRDRIPLAYLINQAFFAGHEFYVDERVLVPRTPFAELIHAQFSPWIAADQVRTAVDLGTSLPNWPQPSQDGLKTPRLALPAGTGRAVSRALCLSIPLDASFPRKTYPSYRPAF